MVSNFLKLILLLYFCIIIFIYKNKKEQKILMKSVFISIKSQLIEAIIINFIFIILFIFFFRFLRLFLIKDNFYFDLKKLYKFFVFDCNLSNFDIVIILIVILLIINFIKKIVIILIKLNYLRIHYFYLYRHEYFRKIIFYIQNIEYKIYFSLEKNKKKFAFLFFMIRFFFRYLLIIIFIKNIIFDNMVITLGFLPFYAFYYLILSIFNFFKLMEIDFEKGSLQFYYQKECCCFITRLGFRKLFLYHRKLIIGYSKYNFMNSLIYDYKLINKIPNNWIFYCYKDVSIIFSISKRIKPRIISY